MTDIYSSYSGHRSAWRADSFKSVDDLVFPLEGKHIDALESALRRVKARGLQMCDITPKEFPLTEIADDIDELRELVLNGRGVVFLRGFPVEKYNEPDITLMYWGLGTHFGLALSQSVIGDRVGRVTNIGDLDPHERAYRNRRRLMPHTDRSHLIAMLCVRAAKAGGMSGYVNGIETHNVIAREHPEYLPVLYRGFRQHRFGEEPDDEPAVADYRPIFTECEGVPSMQYIRGYYDMAMEETGQPYSELEQGALDFMDEVILRPEMKFDVYHQPGDLSLINNFVVMHSRTQFEDFDEPARKRLFLRLWLHMPGTRPLVDDFVLDEFHAGVPEQSSRGSSYFDRWQRKIVQND